MHSRKVFFPYFSFSIKNSKNVIYNILKFNLKNFITIKICLVTLKPPTTNMFSKEKVHLLATGTKKEQ